MKDPIRSAILGSALTRQAERGMQWVLKDEVLRELCPPGGGKGQRRPIKKPGAWKKKEMSGNER